ncbi:MAG: hypothetical protein ACOYKE_02475 [Ferruginibacter sp.]
MSKLFVPVESGHDGKARVVHICADANGYYVYKPQTGFKSKHWKKKNAVELANCFNQQLSCTQNNAFYDSSSKPSETEEYPEVI